MPKNNFQPPIGFGECRTDIVKETSTVDGRTVTIFKTVTRKRSEITVPHSSQFPKLKELLKAGISPEKVSCVLDSMDPQERLEFNQHIANKNYSKILDIIEENDNPVIETPVTDNPQPVTTEN